MYGSDKDRNTTHKKLIFDAQKYVNDKKLSIDIKDHLSQFQKMREKADYKRLQVIDEKFLENALVIFHIVEKDCLNIWGNTFSADEDK